MVGRSTARKVQKLGSKAASGVARTLADPKKTKRLIAAGKVLAPVVAPLAFKALESARYLVDQQRAKKLGVDVDDVAAYRGPTGRTKARIDAVGNAIVELRERHAGDPAAIDFANRANATLKDLTSATAAAAPMPAVRRRPTLDAVGRELDQLEAELITHLMRTGA